MREMEGLGPPPCSGVSVLVVGEAEGREVVVS
jgi:hypothetical protein